MAERKHTAGPWSTQKPGDGYHGLRVVGPGGGELCRANEANARLIAAAPSLLEACEESLRLLENRLEFAEIDDEEKWHLNTLRAAIAKAKGE